MAPTHSHEAAVPNTRETSHDELVLQHLDVADGLARRYRNRGISYDDLFQVACLGLVKASRGFDPERGTPFISYAVATMLGEIKRHFRDHAWAIRPPRRIQQLRAELSSASSEWRQRTGVEPTAGELAATVGASRSAVHEALLADDCFAPMPLERRTASDDGAGARVHVPYDEPGYAHVELAATVWPACARLSPRDRRIVALRFVHQWSQARIAAEIGVSQIQVSRLLRRILLQLRRELAEVDPSVPITRTGLGPAD